MRPLRADEIEVRVGQVGQKGASMLLYKNARVDMTILDEEVGAENWGCHYREIKGNLFCEVSIWNTETKEWTSKEDCGTESYTEKEKGEASDAFKRACFKWGIGRELYSAPFIFLPTGTVQDGNRWKLANPREFVGVYVNEIEYAEADQKRTISKLVLYQRAQGRDTEIFRWPKGVK